MSRRSVMQAAVAALIVFAPPVLAHPDLASDPALAPVRPPELAEIGPRCGTGLAAVTITALNVPADQREPACTAG